MTEMTTPSRSLTPEANRNRRVAAAKRKALADERARKALQLRIVDGYSFRQIAQELGISAGASLEAYRRGVRDSVPRQGLDEARALALEKLDQWERMTLDIYHSEHVLVSFGKAVAQGRDPVTNRVIFAEDHGPKLRAIAQLVQIENTRRSITGYSAPQRRVLNVVTEDMLDRALRELTDEAERLEKDTAEIEARRDGKF